MHFMNPPPWRALLLLLGLVLLAAGPARAETPALYEAAVIADTTAAPGFATMEQGDIAAIFPAGHPFGTRERELFAVFTILAQPGFAAGLVQPLYGEAVQAEGFDSLSTPGENGPDFGGEGEGGEDDPDPNGLPLLAERRFALDLSKIGSPNQVLDFSDLANLPPTLVDKAAEIPK